MSPLEFFFDPVLRAPTIGSMLMCLASSLVGVIVFIRKRSLVGEALSHASYPGVVISVIVAASFFPHSEEWVAAAILIGAFCFAMLGLWVIDRMEKRLSVKNDAALCFVLSIFFGIGVLIASRIQTTHALWYKQVQVFLYGQTATMTDVHIVIYGALALATAGAVFFLFRPIRIINFDADFAKSIGMPTKSVEACLYVLLGLAIVIGIRSVGVVLMSGMLIAPAVAARQFTHRLSSLFVLAGLFAVLSGFLGNYFSLELPQWVGKGNGQPLFSLPTGPMILLFASTICLFSLLFAPGCGLVSRFLRVARFKDQCRLENILKSLWKKGEGGDIGSLDLARVSQRMIWRLQNKGYLEKTGKQKYRLSEKGWKRATRIVRLHRLWEVYLVDYLGQGVEKVHSNAEEMEHIITPEIEKELDELLSDPKRDPHHQPIPAKNGALR